MGRPEGIEAVLAAKFQVLLPHLDERQRRLAIGAEALSLGHGGIRIVAAAAGVREATVSRGATELDSGQAPLGRVRHPGGGQKKAVELNPGPRPALLALVEPDERGDPMSPLRWTTKSTRKLAAELTRQGHRVAADTVAGLLREEGFSLQANAKTIEGAQHPDRDAQFRYLNEQARDLRDAGDPVISVDSKKKELIGDYRNAGHEWQPAGQPGGQDARLPRTGREDNSVRNLRHDGEHRLGQHRHRPEPVSSEESLGVAIRVAPLAVYQLARSRGDACDATKIKCQTTHRPASPFVAEPDPRVLRPQLHAGPGDTAVRSAPDDGLQRSVVSTKSARERRRRVMTWAFSQHRTSTGVSTDRQITLNYAS
jgi:hypothetical protein